MVEMYITNDISWEIAFDRSKTILYVYYTSKIKSIKYSILLRKKNCKQFECNLNNALHWE